LVVDWSCHPDSPAAQLSSNWEPRGVMVRVMGVWMVTAIAAEVAVAPRESDARAVRVCGCLLYTSRCV